MAKDKNNTIVDRAWDFMASIKLAIILFALISLTSIVGTILEQNAAPSKNIQVLGSLFGESLAPTLYVAFEKLGFMNMYRSWWFLMLLMLFAANLIICTLDRFPRILRLVKDPVKPLSKEHMAAIPLKKEFTIKGKPGAAKDAVMKAMKKTGVKVMESNEGGDIQLYGERRRFSRLGVFVTHLSVIVMLIGAVIGIFFGFNGSLNIPEGAMYTVAFARTGLLTPAQDNEQNVIIRAVENARGDVAVAANRLGVEEDHLRARMRRLGVIPLEFGLRLEDFDVDFYGMSDMAKEYSSVLTVVDGGREIIKKRIEVNDPLQYKGITFYQSSYGLMPPGDYRYILRATSRNGATETMTVRKGETFTVPGTSVEASVAEFNASLAFDPSGKPFTYAQFMNNPAVRLEIKKGQESYSKWIMKRNSNTWRFTSGDVIELRDVIGAQYTGLQVRRDPGVWIVYLGCALMSAGLYIAFFMNHRKVWVMLSPAKGGTDITVAASANKNREALERKIDRMISLLREGGK
jgi:cytochrome c biogenesis protein